MSITIVQRSVKGSPLNSTEVDANWVNTAAAIENVTTGHDHDGTDSKKVTKENVLGLTTADSPTFVGETLSGLTASRGVVTDGSKVLTSDSAATGSGAPVRATSPALVTPALGTPASGVMTNCTSATPAVNDNSTKMATTEFIQTKFGVYDIHEIDELCSVD